MGSRRRLNRSTANGASGVRLIPGSSTRWSFRRWNGRNCTHLRTTGPTGKCWSRVPFPLPIPLSTTSPQTFRKEPP